MWSQFHSIIETRKKDARMLLIRYGACVIMPRCHDVIIYHSIQFSNLQDGFGLLGCGSLHYGDFPICPQLDQNMLLSTEMEKRADSADISVLFFPQLC